MELTQSFLDLLAHFAPVFTEPTFRTFAQICSGWVLSHRHRYITDVIFSGGNIAKGYFKDQILPIELKSKKGPTQFDTDEHVRGDASLEGMAKLRAVFAKENGTVTAGNASGINDAAAAVVLLITVWASVRASRTAKGGGSELAMAVLLPAGLLLYPGTLAHYTVVLLAPLVWLWSRHGATTIRGAWIAVLIALVYAITHYDAGHDAIVATAAVWITLVALAAWPEPALMAIPTTGRYGSATTSAIANPS